MKILFAVFILMMSAKAFGDGETKVVEERFNINQTSIVELNNKFGDIDVKNWERDEAYIKVTITVESKDAEQAKEILEDININFSESGNRIIATTEFGESLDKGGFIWGKSGRYEYDVHYEVMVPEYTNMTVNNKYGDVFINNLAGHFICSVGYGKIQINNLLRDDEKPLNMIELAYGGGTIQSIGWAKINMKYSNLEITRARALITVSKYSKLFMDEGSSLVAESKYDTYKIGKLSNFVAAAAYSNFKFEEISEQFHIESKYSNGTIEHVPASFEKIGIESAYGRFNIGIDENATYSIDGEANYSKIYYLDGPWKVQRIDEGTSLEVNGIIGNSASTESVVEIETKYGDVNLNY